MARPAHSAAPAATFIIPAATVTPQYQTRAKEAWLAARQRELLPVPYFHQVLTLPHALNGVASRHPKLIYALLFRSAADTLTTFAANPRWLGGQPAFTLVLHTWQQNLGRHCMCMRWRLAEP